MSRVLADDVTGFHYWSFKMKQMIDEETGYAEHCLTQSIRELRQRIDETEKKLTDPTKYGAFNSLGELHTSAAQFEAAVGALRVLRRLNKKD